MTTAKRPMRVAERNATFGPQGAPPLPAPTTTIRCPRHADDLTPTQARLLAVTLVRLADRAEGFTGGQGFVTRWEVLAELAQLRSEVKRVRTALER